MKTIQQKAIKILIGFVLTAALSQNLQASPEKRTYIGLQNESKSEEKLELNNSDGIQTEEKMTENQTITDPISICKSEEVTNRISELNSNNPDNQLLVPSVIDTPANTANNEIQINNNTVINTNESSINTSQVQLTSVDKPKTIRVDDIPLKWEYKMKE